MNPPTRRVFLTQLALGGSIILGGRLWAADSSTSGGGGLVPLAPPDKQPPDLEMPPITKPVGWAIVGLGKLALEEIMPAFAQCHTAKPVALVSGHPDKARKVAKAYDIPEENIYNYENYDEMAKNPAIQIVYIVLPNHMHAEYTIRALKAGKDVLCEKPMAATVQEAEQMIAVARETKRQLMIAYRLHYEPYNQTVIKMCQDQELGRIKTFTAENSQDVQPPNIRLSKETAGGPLGDIGVYCINAARYVTGEQPIEVSAFARQPQDDPRFREVPETINFLMRFPSGVMADCTCCFGAAESRRFRVTCEKGYIDLDSAFAYRGQRLKVRRDKEVEELLIDPVDHFAAEMDHFSESVIHGHACHTPGEMGLADMQVMEAIKKSIASGKAEKVAGA